MKKVKFLFMAFVAVAMTLASCTKDEPTTPVVPVDPPKGLEEQPVIAAPAVGKVTIAVRVPEGSVCQGLVAIGAGSPDFAADWKLTSVVPFVKVSDTKTWYSVTLTYAADMAVKVIAVPQDGQSSLGWGTQWGMNTNDVTNVTFVEEPTTAVFATENGGEVKLTKLADQDVVYIDVAAWKSAPCVAKNPAGSVVFNVTVPETTPLTASVMLVGNFADPNNWNLSATGLLMTNNGNRTYTITTDVPAACEYKYVVSADGTTWDWANNEVFLTPNRSMPLDLQVNDVVTAWAAAPWMIE